MTPCAVLEDPDTVIAPNRHDGTHINPCVSLHVKPSKSIAPPLNFTFRSSAFHNAPSAPSPATAEFLHLMLNSHLLLSDEKRFAPRASKVFFALQSWDDNKSPSKIVLSLSISGCPILVDGRLPSDVVRVLPHVVRHSRPRHPRTRAQRGRRRGPFASALRRPLRSTRILGVTCRLRRFSSS